MQQAYINIHTHKKSKKGVISLVNIHAYLPYPTENILYKTAGVHPWNTDKEEMNRQLIALIELCDKKQLTAIGECGLDKVKGFPITQQIETFEQQIVLAEQFNLPLIIHAVKAQEELFDLRKKHPENTWILHGFRGNAMMAEQFINMQIKLSFGVDILSDVLKLSAALKNIPLSDMYLETDDSNIDIQDVYKKAAQIKKITEEDILSQIYANFKRDFLAKKNGRLE